MSLAAWLNTAWMLRCAGEARAFGRATGRVAEAQAALLREIVSQNQETQFGRQHGFGQIHDPGQYQQQVPLSTYESYVTPIERIAAGRANVLTTERVELLEPTSGTTGGEKLIPYTAGLRRQFQRAVAAWVADLLWHRPAVRHGRAYWSISPALGRSRRTAGGVPIGFEDDSAYLGGLERFALSRILVVPSGVSRIVDIEAFRYCTLLCLLRAQDLALLSVWNPTFLSALLRRLEDWHDRLCYDLKHGTCQAPTFLAPALARRLSRRGRAYPQRAASLQAIFRSSLPLADKLRQAWPRLA